VIVRAVDTTDTKCPHGQICGGPPVVVPASRLRTWTDRARGVSLQYPVDTFAVDNQTGDRLRLHVRSARPSGVEATLWVTAHPSSDGAPAELLRQRRADLASSILGLTEDGDPRTVTPPPHIGDIRGVGGSYRGTVDTPQGPSEPAIAILAAAGNGRTTTVVSYVITGTDDASEVRLLRGYLSPILTTFTWRP
jgi:hypothetical protein